MEQAQQPQRQQMERLERERLRVVEEERLRREETLKKQQERERLERAYKEEDCERAPKEKVSNDEETPLALTPEEEYKRRMERVRSPVPIASEWKVKVGKKTQLESEAEDVNAGTVDAGKAGFGLKPEKGKERERDIAMAGDDTYSKSHTVFVANVFVRDLQRLYDAMRPAGEIVGIRFHTDLYGSMWFVVHV